MSTASPTIGFIDDPMFDLHQTGRHPENATRLAGIRQALANSHVQHSLTRLTFAAADPADLALAHDPAHIQVIKAVASQGGAWLDGDTIVTARSYEVAAHAAGAATRAVGAVLAGEHPASVAIVRPPGHHATGDQAMGFCLFNNVAVAARVARQRYGIERTLIVDFDVHHGNGTQDIFYSDPSVFYFSIHQWPLFPGTGRIEETGKGAGLGMNANVPIPARCGDDDYRQVFEDVLLPLARRYQPELVLVSAGYDAYWDDPLAEERVTVQGFAHLVAAVKAIADEHCPGRLSLVLEGGYNPAGLGAGLVASIGELLGEHEVSEPEPVPDLRGGPDIRDLISKVRATHGM